MAAKDQTKKPKQTNQPKATKQNSQTTNKQKSRKKLEDIISAENSRVFSRKFLKRAKQLPADADKLVFMKKKNCFKQVPQNQPKISKHFTS